MAAIIDNYDQPKYKVSQGFCSAYLPKILPGHFSGLIESPTP
jgi:hypothetical protein